MASAPGEFRSTVALSRIWKGPLERPVGNGPCLVGTQDRRAGIAARKARNSFLLFTFHPVKAGHPAWKDNVDLSFIIWA